MNGHGGRYATHDSYNRLNGGYDHQLEQEYSNRTRSPATHENYNSSSPDRRAGTRAGGRQTDLERRRAQRRSRSRSRAGEGRAVRQIEDVIHYINREWTFMTKDQCVPVQVALQLLDDSSLGLASRYDEFLDTQQQLQEALRAVVNEHHQGFNSSIGTFHQIQTSIQSSQQRVRDLKDSLLDAKKNLTTTKSEFRNLVDTSHNYESMLDVLGSIEKIQQIPEQLESSISDKHFLRAVDSLQEALRLIRSPEMDEINALNDMRIYLSNQEHSLIDILSEELHNHLYLKSPYCEERWTNYAKLHRQGGTSRPFDAGVRPIYTFLDEVDFTTPLIEDSSRSPELNSFYYIHMIVECLVKLGKLEEAVEGIEQRMPVELYKVVERTNSEIQQRHPNSVHIQWNSPNSLSELAVDNKRRQSVLEDLLATLYAKFDAIAESHRALHEVLVGISRRDDMWGNTRLTRGFKELWKLYQSEMRSLLHDYLSTRGSLAQRMGRGENEGNMFRYQRDKSKKPTFKMDWIDGSSSDLKSEQDEVVTIWQKFVPGLVSLTQTNSKNGNNTANGQQESSGTGHKLLVEPSVFNIGTLLPPSVFFLNRLKELVPPGTDIVVSTLSSFLNDFLINVFQPQLEETLVDYCSQCFVQLDAFQQDPRWMQNSPKPVFKGTTKFFEIISAFCKMLDDLTHDQSFSQLVITQLNTYYDKCVAWFKALATRAQEKPQGRTVKVSALFAESGAISEVVTRLMSAEDAEKAPLISEEISRLLAETENNAVDESDLISDRKTQISLCLLHTSMKWLAEKLKTLRRISDRATDVSGMDEDEKPQLKRSLTATIVANRESADEKRVFLPLTTATAGLFDGVVSAFNDLSSLVLRTLHIELRCHVLKSLRPCFSGSLILSEATDAPDEPILGLVYNLSDFNQHISSYLQHTEYAYITTGTQATVDAGFLRSIVRNTRAMNALGAQHLELNAKVLYHNLLNIEPWGDLPKSLAYVRLFQQGAEGIISSLSSASARNTVTFTKLELRALLRLWYSTEMESTDRDEALRAKERLDAGLVRLS